MLTPTLKSSRVRPGTEHGFTLAELSVAMFAGVVVIIGLFTIIDVTLHQTQRTFTKVDATQRARTALAKIENELHSACVGGSAPIQGVTNGAIESDANNLVFLSFSGTSANPVPVWHHIAFNSSAATLTDTTYPVTGTAPDWSQGSSPTATTTLLTNVAQLASTTPAFQYYAYKPEYTDSSGNQYMLVPDGTNLVPGNSTAPNQRLATSAGLSASDAASTVEVVINLLVGSSSQVGLNTTLQSDEDSVTDAVSLRLTTPPDYVPSGSTPTGYGPCQ